MPEIQVKDKLITLEELGTAYNNTVKKSGDTMTGQLTVPNMVVKSGSWQFYYMQDANGADVGHMRGEDTNHSIAFREYVPETNNVYEDYYLPNPTGPAAYNILTTKSPVGIPQGGTGATTPAGARQNFFPDDLSNESVAYMAGFTTGWAKGGWLQLPLPLPYGGTGATAWDGARENLGVIARQEIVPFDANGLGTINTPNGFVPFAAVLDYNWFITVLPPNRIIARSPNDYNTLIRDTTISVSILYAKLA